MASVGEPLNRSPFMNNSQGFNPHLAKSIPILPSSAASATSTGDPMDTRQNQTPPMGPPMHNSPNGDRMSEQPSSGEHPTTNGGSSQPVGAAAAAQHPKVVQTAFIHKLYKLVFPCNDSGHTTDSHAACSKTRAYSILSHGRVQMRASSCRHRPSSQRSWRKSFKL